MDLPGFLQKPGRLGGWLNSVFALVGIILVNRATQRLTRQGSMITGAMVLGFAVSVTGGEEADFLVGSCAEPILADGPNRTGLGSALCQRGILS